MNNLKVTRKIIMIMFCMILLVGTVSAWDWDNILTYEDNDMKVRIRNGFGLLGDIGEAELKSHKSVDEVVNYSIGSNHTVIWYETNWNKLSKNGLGVVEFINMTDGELIDVDYRFVIWGTQKRYQDIYGKTDNCFIQSNGTKECEWGFIRTEEFDLEGWVPYDSKDIPKGKSRIGIEVYVNKGDVIDGIWTFEGKKAKKHVVWGNDVVDAHGISFVGGGSVSVQTGMKINTNNVIRGITFTKHPSDTSTRAKILNSAKALVASAAFVGINATFAFEMTDATDYYLSVDSSGANYVRYGIGAGASFPYVGTNIDYVGGLVDTTDGVTFAYGVVSFTSQTIIPDGIPNVTLSIPENNSNLSSPIIDFFCNVSDDNGITNVSLYIDGVINETNSSGVNNTNYTWQRILTNGNYNWTCEVFDSENQSNIAEEFLFSINIIPFIEFVAPTLANNTNLSNNAIPANISLTEDLFNNLTIFLYNSTGLHDGINLTNATRFNNFTGLADGTYYLNATTCTTTDQCNSTETREYLIDATPPVISLITPNGTFDVGAAGGSEGLNWTALDEHNDTCWFDYNNVNTTVTCGDNTTTFTLVADVFTLTFYMNDTFGNIASNTTNWTYKIFEHSMTANSSTFETKIESFTTNISTTVGTPTSAILNYNGTNFTGTTITTEGDNFIISNSIQIPIGIGGANWYYIIGINATTIQTTTTAQTINELVFSLCTPTINVPYINFSFKNETLTQESINATISSTWIYSLGSFDASKQLSFSNATENINYTFCSSASNDTININMNMTYANSESQQRAFTLTAMLSNVTTNQVLYLLPTVSGIFSQFRTEDTLGNTIVGAKAVITRVLGGSTITVGSSFTDGGGTVVFFLDPDDTYSATFSATAFLDNAFTFVPITDLRIIIMATTIQAGGEGSNVSLSTKYNIIPSNSSLNNNTVTLFGFNVTSSEDITFIGFDIRNTSGDILLIVNDTSTGFISGSINTGNDSKLIGTFVYQTANETIAIKKVWFIGEDFPGDYSLFTQGTLYLDYGFDDFYKLLIILISIIGLLIFMSADGQIEDETKIAAVVLVVWGWSVLGWLDTGIVVESTSANVNTLTELSSQYGIAILSTGIASYFILRRIFRQI